MVSLVIDNTVQVRLVWGLGGVPYAVNVLHGIIKDPLTTIDQAKADDLRDKVEAVITPQGWIGEVSQHVSLLNIGLRNLNSPNNPEFLATSTYAGTNPVNMLPLNACICATLRTDKAGRSYRGRFYASGLCTDATTPTGTIAANVSGSLVEFLNGVKQGMDDAGFTMSVASRKLGISEAINQILVRDAQWDTQRRRATPGI